MTVQDGSAIDTGDYAPGDILADRYTLVKPLGAGGMGVVWVAHAKNLDVNVAVKLLRGSLAGTHAVDRMSREARAAAKLGHYAMARVLDFGQTSRDDPFLVMELLEGESLRELLDRKVSIEPVRAVRTLLPIADALMVAHDKGIVHRDVKPGNVFISHEDQGRIQPKLLDFGVAKLEESTLDDKRRKLTDLGAVLGSPDYLSPEQARGENDIDGRSDVWAFCVVLYEVICGRPPFEHMNYNALLHAITTEEPKPISTYGIHDDHLSEIIRKGMAKDKAERWQGMRPLGEALARWLVAQGIEEDICTNSLKARWINAEHRISYTTRARLRDSLPPSVVVSSNTPAGKFTTRIVKRVSPQKAWVRQQKEWLIKNKAPLLVGGAVVLLCLLVVWALSDNPQAEIPTAQAASGSASSGWSAPQHSGANPSGSASGETKEDNAVYIQDLPMEPDAEEAKRKKTKRRWKSPPRPQHKLKPIEDFGF